MLLRVLIALAAAAILATAPHAAHDLETAAVPQSDLELVVIESDGCIYCQIFRRDVLPAYRASLRAREVPLRFVDVNEPEAERLELSEPIDIVPTVILVRRRSEMGRITGYTGPEAFFHSINRLLARVE